MRDGPNQQERDAVDQLLRRISVRNPAIPGMRLRWQWADDMYFKGCLTVEAVYEAPDRETGAPVKIIMSQLLTWGDPNLMDDARLLQLGEDMLRRVFLHEFDECFHVDGRRVHDPHRGEVPDFARPPQQVDRHPAPMYDWLRELPALRPWLRPLTMGDVDAQRPLVDLGPREVGRTNGNFASADAYASLRLNYDEMRDRMVDLPLEPLTLPGRHLVPAHQTGFRRLAEVEHSILSTRLRDELFVRDGVIGEDE